MIHAGTLNSAWLYFPFPLIHVEYFLFHFLSLPPPPSLASLPPSPSPHPHSPFLPFQSCCLHDSLPSTAPEAPRVPSFSCSSNGPMAARHVRPSPSSCRERRCLSTPSPSPPASWHPALQLHSHPRHRPSVLTHHLLLLPLVVWLATSGSRPSTRTPQVGNRTHLLALRMLNHSSGCCWLAGCWRHLTLTSWDRGHSQEQLVYALT